MYHLYRFPGEFVNWPLAIPLSKAEELIRGLGTFGEEFTANWLKVQKAAHLIEWDGTFAYEPHCFPLVAHWGFDYGFVWKQRKFGLTFLASPIKMPHLDDHIDYDAQTDTDTVARARNAMKGIAQSDTPQTLRSMLSSTAWRVSRSRNQWRTINGVVCTIFAKAGEYGGVLTDDVTGRKIFTKKFKTEQEGKDYVDRKFNAIWNPTINDDDADWP